MKTQLTLDVGDYERYVIAQYFAVDGKRQRATRVQVRRFMRAALLTMVKEQATALRGRQRATAERLSRGPVVPETLVRPAEIQPSLL